MAPMHLEDVNDYIREYGTENMFVARSTPQELTQVDDAYGAPRRTAAGRRYLDENIMGDGELTAPEQETFREHLYRILQIWVCWHHHLSKMSAEADDLSSLRVAELRERLAAKGLNTTGKKAELLARLQQSLPSAAPSRRKKEARAIEQARAHNVFYTEKTRQRPKYRWMVFRLTASAASWLKEAKAAFLKDGSCRTTIDKEKADQLIRRRAVTGRGFFR